MRVLVPGAGGMLGRDVVRAATEVGHEVVGADHAALDVANEHAVRDAVVAMRPDAVVNCAGYTDVDGAEADEERALQVNGQGARNVAGAAATAGATVVYVSTDYVFDGRKGAPYVESDEPNPLSSYGRSKLAGERATAAAAPRHVITRSSWLFGAHGPNFVATILRVARERGELAVVDDRVGSPTWTGHLAGALVKLAASKAFGVHHVAACGACSRFELAREALERAGVECRLRPSSSAELALAAPRPAFSALETERSDSVVLPRWRQGLARYLAQMEGRA